jgi:hypothetical protein
MVNGRNGNRKGNYQWYMDGLTIGELIKNSVSDTQIRPNRWKQPSA